MFRINKAIPIPHTSRGDAAGRRKYPFDELEIGDMFFIPNKEKNTLSTHTSTVSKKLGKHFKTRLIHMTGSEEAGWTPASKADEGSVLGIGVWRVEAPPAKDEAAVEGSDDDGELVAVDEAAHRRRA